MGISTQPPPLGRNTILPFPSHCPNDFLIMPPKSRASAGHLHLSLGIHDRGVVTASPCDFCLEQVEGHARKKLRCLVEEMEAEGEDLSVMVIDASALQAELFSPAPVNTAAAGAGSSQGS